MIGDRHLAELAAAAYLSPPSWARGDVHVVATARAPATIVAFRGTQDARDWLRDFDAVPRDDPSLGPCHAGFLTGVRGVEGQMMADLGDGPVILTGHSLGGAMALLFAARLIVAGRPPLAVVVFGAPRPGFGRLRRVLAGAPVLRLYRHGNDPVPDLPLWPYVDVAGRLSIGAPAADPLADHLIAGYIAALASLDSTPA